MKKVLIIILALFVSNVSYAADSSFTNTATGNSTKSCKQYATSNGSADQGNRASTLTLSNGMAGETVYTSFPFYVSSSGAGTQTIAHISDNFDDVAVAGKISASPSLAGTSLAAGQNLVSNSYSLSGVIIDALSANDVYEWQDTVKCTITQ
jgi:hypothetical protein